MDFFQQTASDKMQLFQWCQRSQIKNSKRPDHDCQIEREHPTNVLLPWSNVENPSEPSPSLLSYYPVFPPLAPMVFLRCFSMLNQVQPPKVSTFAESFPLLVHGGTTVGDISRSPQAPHHQMTKCITAVICCRWLGAETNKLMEFIMNPMKKVLDNV